MFRPALLVLGAVLFAGCLTVDPFDYRLPERYPDRWPDTRRAEDVRRTADFRRIDRDAEAYARRVDRAVGLDRRTERAVAERLAARAERLLLNTRVRDLRAVYPFPRREDTRAMRDFWRAADRDVEALLGRRDRERYREFVRYGDRYEHRRDDDRGWGRDDGRRGRGDAHGRGVGR